VIPFADSSAVVKIYGDEPGCDVVRAHPTLVVSQLCRVEVAAAIWRKQRLGELSPAQAADLVAEFEADYADSSSRAGRFVVVAVTAEVLEHAAAASATYGLRAFDAVQLASALVARDAAPQIDTMLAWDGHLRDAAARAGLHVEP
jgi:predicted nucleic acid-binding protein